MIKISKHLFHTNNLAAEGVTAYHSAGVPDMGTLSLCFKDDDAEANFLKHFLRLLNQKLLASRPVSFVLAEHYPKKQNRVRSKRLMFHQERKSAVLASEDVLELEVEFNEEGTIITGMVSLTADKLDYCLANLLNEYFVFGYIGQEDDCHRFPPDAELWLKAMVQTYSTSSNRFELDYPNFARWLLQDGQFLYEIGLNSQSQHILTFYGQEKALTELEELLTNQIGKYPIRSI